MKKSEGFFIGSIIFILILLSPVIISQVVGVTVIELTEKVRDFLLKQRKEILLDNQL